MKVIFAICTYYFQTAQKRSGEREDVRKYLLGMRESIGENNPLAEDACSAIKYALERIDNGNPRRLKATVERAEKNLQIYLEK